MTFLTSSQHEATVSPVRVPESFEIARSVHRLRTTARLLVRMRDDCASMHVMLPVPSDDVAEEALVRAVEHLAREYGLRAAIRRDGAAITVGFTRGPDD